MCEQICRRNLALRTNIDSLLALYFYLCAILCLDKALHVIAVDRTNSAKVQQLYAIENRIYIPNAL